MEDAKIIVNGIEYSKDQVLAMAAELKDLTAVVKVARKEGMLKKAKTVREDDPRKILLAGLFEGVITEQIDEIQGLFDDTKSDEKPYGNTGINICIKGIPFDVQILSDEAKEKKTAATKATKKTVAEGIAEMEERNAEQAE